GSPRGGGSRRSSQERQTRGASSIRLTPHLPVDVTDLLRDPRSRHARGAARRSSRPYRSSATSFRATAPPQAGGFRGGTTMIERRTGRAGGHAGSDAIGVAVPPRGTAGTGMVGGVPSTGIA